MAAFIFERTPRSFGVNLQDGSQASLRLNPNLPIGIFDSGVGGLTVYRALHERLPDERFVYLGDTARVPYGTKSLATVERYAIENSRFLEARGIKLLVVACNTASALALPAIRRAVSVDVIGVIEPGARAAAESSEGQSRSARIGVIATEATAHSGAYSAAIARFAPGVTVIERACPLFVALAEEGWAETNVAREVAAEYLRDLREQSVETLVLGCTHYPILRRVIQETLGHQVRLIDSGEAAARDVESRLETNGLAREAPEDKARERHLCDDLDHFYVTDAAERFSRVAERFLGSAPSVLEAVEVWGHDELRTH
ncbi:MAG: glutamate racemase [Blastocatellia bacterium]|nr:glutamate racemase [Blastocatellia bacterium]